jgi:hypothetical protein
VKEEKKKQPRSLRIIEGGKKQERGRKNTMKIGNEKEKRNKKSEN